LRTCCRTTGKQLLNSVSCPLRPFGTALNETVFPSESVILLMFELLQVKVVEAEVLEENVLEDNKHMKNQN
jgi:hypothetical protein